MDPDDDPAERSTCTTCTFPDDFSNYWTASMFYRARNGTYRRVQQLGALYHEEARGGGITIYYVPYRSDAPMNITGFQKGFRMRNGDPGVGTAEEAAEYQGIDYTCLINEGTRFTNRSLTFPDHMCPAGIITTIYFPPCWDGVRLDTANHYDHVAWPEDEDAFCPESHPVTIPQVILEIRWDTQPYNDPELWPEDGSQPFLWSFGDGVGYGHHGDYLFGWKEDTLQTAFDRESCTDQICGLTLQEIPEANECMIDPVAYEEEDWLDHLPGLKG